MPIDYNDIVQSIISSVIVSLLGSIAAGVIKSRGDPVTSISRAVIALLASLPLGGVWFFCSLFALQPLTDPLGIPQRVFAGAPQLEATLKSLAPLGWCAFTIVPVWHGVQSDSLLRAMAGQAVVAFGVLLTMIVPMAVIVAVALLASVAAIWLVPIHVLLMLRLQWRISERLRTLPALSAENLVDLGELPFSLWECIKVYFTGRRIK